MTNQQRCGTCGGTGFIGDMEWAKEIVSKHPDDILADRIRFKEQTCPDCGGKPAPLCKEEELEKALNTLLEQERNIRLSLEAQFGLEDYDLSKRGDLYRNRDMVNAWEGYYRVVRAIGRSHD